MSTVLVVSNVTGAPDKADILAMDAAIDSENAIRLAAGNVLPQLDKSTNPLKRTSYATILSQRLTTMHLAACTSALDTANSGSVAKQIRQALPVASPAQLAAGLLGLTT